MIMCVLLSYPLSIHMSQLLSTGRPISSLGNVSVHSHAVNLISSGSTLIFKILSRLYLRNHKV